MKGFLDNKEEVNLSEFLQSDESAEPNGKLSTGFPTEGYVVVRIQVGDVSNMHCMVYIAARFLQSVSQ
jgi:hypothetical protein